MDDADAVPHAEITTFCDLPVEATASAVTVVIAVVQLVTRWMHMFLCAVCLLLFTISCKVCGFQVSFSSSVLHLNVYVFVIWIVFSLYTES